MGIICILMCGYKMWKSIIGEYLNVFEEKFFMKILDMKYRSKIHHRV